MKKNKLLLIGPFPDPISGVSLANKVVKDILEKSKEYSPDFINTSYPVFEDAIGSFSFKKLIFFLTLNSKAIKILKSDIIYMTPGQTFFGVAKYFVFILLSSLLRKKLIIHVHGNYLGKHYQELKGIKKIFLSYLLSKFNKGIVLSNSLVNNLSPFLEKNKIFIAPNFAENYLYEDRMPIITTKLQIVYLSNLMEEKGILYLLDALKILEENNVPYHAKIAGNIDSKLEDSIREKLSKLKSTEYKGVLVGVEKKELLNWSNVFILPTFYKMEGQPISILEALSTNNAIITTNHAGIPDIIKDKQNGFFVKKRNAIDIAEKLIFLSNNPIMLKEFIIFNRNYFLNSFTLDKFGNNIISILDASTES